MEEITHVAGIHSRLMPKDRMRRCLSTIISGQILDLKRFRNPRRTGLVALGSMEETDDYTYRVAGSVGEFWTGK